MLRLSFKGPAATPDAVTLAGLHDVFRSTHCLTLPRMIAPDLLAWVQREISSAHLSERRHGDDGMLASELALPAGTCLGLLAFLFNDPVVLRVVETVTGCAPLTRFFGRVYSRIPGTHFDSWHDDLTPHRLIGMSVNLSTEVYEGGAFEIRDRRSQRTFSTLANVGFGDAILFRISDTLEHRVAPLTGRVAKTAYASWFGDTVDYNLELRRDPMLAD